MPIDYLTLLLINLAAGLVLLAWYIFRGLEDTDQKRWASAFAIVGLIATTAGFAMTFNWPLPGSYNIPYGELSVFFGFLFMGTALSLGFGWSLIPVGLYAFFPGLAAVLMGVRFIDLGLSKQPLLAGVGFILTGLGGVFALPTLSWRNNKAFRVIGALVLLGAAAIWGVTGYGAYWTHMTQFAEWIPATAL